VSPSARPAAAAIGILPVPAGVHSVLARLWNGGFAAYVVGGGVRDALLGRRASDWDVATSALPEQVATLFPAGRYENRFGTVTVPSDTFEVEVTTFRRDHQYADHRRPDQVTFTDSLEEDLARRDFTVNAIAWGRAGAPSDDAQTARWVDPTNGISDLDAGLIRAVGEPAKRFDEDGLRLLRAARFAGQLGFEIEPLTLAAMTETARTVGWVSAERVGGEFRRMVATNRPSRAFTVLAQTGVLEHALPELAAEGGVPQAKIEGHDLLDHSLTSLDAAAQLDPANERLRIAALLHDVGKPGTYADGHFVGHDVEGAKIARQLLARLAFPRRDIEPIAALILQHMFNYESRWSAAAVRRFVRRVGRDLIGDLLLLRAADNIGSGLPANAGRLDELRQRIETELSSNPPLSLRDLAVTGDDLIEALAIKPGPLVGRLLERLLRLVIADPAQNRREVLLAHAQQWLAREAHR
jgi:putative nucleotidyltransferase with HDIG domain